MAHLVLLGQSLTVLGLKSLQHESLDSLEQRLCQIDPSIITHSHILHTYIAWLGARIRVLDDSDSAALRAKISRWCTSLSALRLDKDLALSGFLQWKREQLALKPINARIFTLAGLEIQQAFRGPDLSSHSEAGSSMSSPHGTRPVLTEPEPEPEPDNPFAHMHPSRIPNLDQHTKPRIPVIDLETWPSPVVDLCSDNSDQDQPAPPPKTDEKPSFLTGANGIPASKSQTSIVVQDVKKSKKKSQKQRKKAQKMLLLAKDQQSTPGQPARDEQLQERSLNQEPETPRKHEPRPSQQQKENHVTATPDKMTPLSLLGSDGCPPKDPPKNYVCRRCGVRGHFKRDCPTSLDASYDTTPPADFPCRVCNAKGSHFAEVCPRNLSPNSLTQRRRRALMTTKGGLEGEHGLQNHREPPEARESHREIRARDFSGPWPEEYRGYRETSIPYRNNSFSGRENIYQGRGQDRIDAGSPRSSRKDPFRGSYHSPRRYSSRPGFTADRSESPPSFRGADTMRGRGLLTMSSSRKKSKDRPRNENEGRLSYWDDDYRQGDAEYGPGVGEREPLGSEGEIGTSRAAHRAGDADVSMGNSRDVEAIALAEADAFLDKLGEELFGNSSGMTLNQSPPSLMEVDSRAALVVQYSFGSDSAMQNIPGDVESPSPNEHGGQRQISPPIEPGKTPRSLEKNSQYSSEVLKLFQNHENVRRNKPMRRTALEIWDEMDGKDGKNTKDHMDPLTA